MHARASHAQRRQREVTVLLNLLRIRFPWCVSERHKYTIHNDSQYNKEAE